MRQHRRATEARAHDPALAKLIRRAVDKDPAPASACHLDSQIEGVRIAECPEWQRDQPLAGSLPFHLRSPPQGDRNPYLQGSPTGLNA